MTMARWKQAAWTAAVLAAAAAALILLLRKKPVQVRAVELQRGELRVVVNATTTSTVRSEFEVTLSAQRTGRITELAVREGDRVAKGAVVARLDLTEESVQSESVLAQSAATFQEAERNYRRAEELHAKGLIAQQELDTSRRAFEVARTQHEAAAEDLKVRRGYSVIRAPFDGIIANRYAESGELLLPGKQIVMIVDPDRIYVLATIDEVDVGRLRIGQEVQITVDAFPGEQFRGRIGRISPIVSGGKLETRTADVWIYFAKKDRRLKPGMSADIEILIAALTDVLAVPTQAIIDRSGAKQVYLADAPALRPGIRSKVALRPVEVGESNWVLTEIRSGAGPGALVVTTPGAEGLRDGATVVLERDEAAR